MAIKSIISGIIKLFDTPIILGAIQTFKSCTSNLIKTSSDIPVWTKVGFKLIDGISHREIRL